MIQITRATLNFLDNLLVLIILSLQMTFKKAYQKVHFFSQ